MSTTTKSAGTTSLVGAEVDLFGVPARFEASRTSGQNKQIFRFAFDQDLSLGSVLEALPVAGALSPGDIILENASVEIEKSPKQRQPAFKFKGELDIGGVDSELEIDFKKGGSGRGGARKTGMPSL